MKMIQSEKNISIAFSVLFHTILLVIFLFIQFDWQMEIPEFIELHFERSAGGAPTVQQSAVSKLEPQKVDLPERKEIEPDENELKVIEHDKFVPEENVKIVATIESEKIIPDIENRLPGDAKELADFQMDDKLLPEIDAAAGLTDESPFEIEGKAANRTILFKVIPQYPENLQQEAVIKIRFSVLPNGLVGEMIPVLKSNDLLERTTLNAFKKWRFNPLPSDVPQNAEYGTITFRYLLK